MSVLPARQNFTIWRGGTWRKQLTLHTGATVDTPKRDLTGFTALFRVEDLDGILLFSLTVEESENGIIYLGGTAGTITVVIPDEVTDALTWEAARYELRITASGGDTDPILWGALTVKGV